MAQFTIYKSSDSGAPGFYGYTGSVLSVLDACLVTGYGNQTGSGWSKPFSNTGSVLNTQSYGCWKQPTGSAMTLFINDNLPNATAGTKECWATGWENLTSLSSSVTTTNGSGSGQFPTPSQLLTSGHVVIRKSATNDSSSLRQWVVAADSSSFYMFIATGDTANMYYGFAFGDIYSFKPTTDSFRCVIIGRNGENTAAAGNDGFDSFTSMTTATAANFIVRSYTGNGTSSVMGKHGDSVKGGTTFSGSTPFGNVVDNALYLSPIWVVENAIPTIRGQLRGLYQPAHPSTNFSDGQIFTGSLDYTGKTFQVFKLSPNNGMYVIETSNTLLTN